METKSDCAKATTHRVRILPDHAGRFKPGPSTMGRMTTEPRAVYIENFCINIIYKS